MRTLAIDEDFNIYLDAQGGLAVVGDALAIQTLCAAAMRVRRGELVYNLPGGMPMFETAFDNFSAPLFEAAARLTLRKIPGVISVDSFTVSLEDGETLKYEAQIRTAFGPIWINQND